MGVSCFRKLFYRCMQMSVTPAGEGVTENHKVKGLLLNRIIHPLFRSTNGLTLTSNWKCGFFLPRSNFIMKEY